MEMAPTLQLHIVVDVGACVCVGGAFHGVVFFVLLIWLDVKDQWFVASYAPCHFYYYVSMAQCLLLV